MMATKNGLSYIPNQPYNHNEAYHPHSTVLEPADFDSESGNLKLTCRPFCLPSDTCGDHDFLRAISLTLLAPTAYATNKCAWKYNERHSAQSILPFLYLGPASVARDSAYIKDKNITMAIVVRSAQSARTQPKWLDPSRFQSCANIQTATFDIDGPYDLIRRIKPMLKTMTDHLQSLTTASQLNTVNDVGGRILVFCENGNDRSPVLVAAYIMLVYGISWHESLNFIHAFRFSVSLNGGLNDMLRTWQGILQAESDTATFPSKNGTSTSTCNAPRKVKRSIEDAYDSDETMTEDIEVATRPGVEPFADVRR